MITSLSEDVGLVHRRGQLKQFQLAYKNCEDMQKINQKIVGRLQLYQQVYYEDYKQQVDVMSQELKKLKTNLDSEVLYNKSSDKMYVLEEERDFFRAQVLKLNEQQNKMLKQKVFDLTDEMSHYKTITFNFQKKIQKLQLEKTSMNSNFRRQTSNQTIQMRNKKKEDNQTINKLHRTLDQKGSASNSRVSVVEHKPKMAMAVRAKTYSKVESATKASMRRYQQANQRDQIIDQCIKQTKKEILLRNSQPKCQIPYDEMAKLTFDKFTRTDKKNVVSKLLNNEKLVEEFAQFLTTRNSIDTQSRVVRTKLGDEKHNQRFLTDLKRSFNKKMFNLKANPIQRIKKEYQLQ